MSHRQINKLNSHKQDNHKRNSHNQNNNLDDNNDPTLLYVAPYGGYLKDLIHELKLGKNTELKLPLGRLLALRVLLEEEKKLHDKGLAHIFKYIFVDIFKDILKFILFDKSSLCDKIDTITFIPLHYNRLIERGFNQAELLAEVVSDSLKIPAYELLVRSEDTIPQGQLGRKERLLNIKGKFDINLHIEKECYLKKRILLIDDISTTGASLEEGRRVLLQNGASEITSLVLCR
ncbi:ComF family protein [Natranaerofaba carboxydovora]|uniref:ComF family protein n=1 Tax=Natranaerofaba carboxydovora TaxID=2742683 RepID=UPI001F138FF5|nr:hypothetical protein [Natranaerofaba carboxydovora]UMZ75000.1 comF: comF family protein [Natranaerofaba carboxydovora]